MYVEGLTCVFYVALPLLCAHTLLTPSLYWQVNNKKEDLPHVVHNDKEKITSLFCKATLLC